MIAPRGKVLDAHVPKETGQYSVLNINNGIIQTLTKYDIDRFMI